jgi:glycosyltransferase involved in cell wall biosynthesis
MTSLRPRLLFLITEDWYFWSHRLDLARAARDAGYDVSVATRVQDHGPRIEAERIRVIPISLERRSRRPFRELKAIHELRELYRREKPMIAHHVAMKPILYGAVAARAANVPVVVNAFAGLGSAFIGRSWTTAPFRAVLNKSLAWALAPPCATAVFQNEDDRSLFVAGRMIAANRTRIIRGAGVNLKVFHPQPVPASNPIVLLASRMLWDKGVGEFVEAARLLKSGGTKARFVLVGQSDSHNPTAIPPEQLNQWVRDGLVEWWGHREEMAGVLSEASIVVLPSYREGLPKVLLEAAACGRPIVASDVPGCREIVRPNVNGFLVAAKESTGLARAISNLLADPALRFSMGRKGRELVEQEYSAEGIARQTLNLYRELLGSAEAH